MANELIEKLKEIDIIYKNPVVLSSGKHSEFYVDVKKAYGNPDALNLIAESLWHRIDKNTTCVAAMGYGGLPPASLIESRYDLKLVMVRNEPKSWGRNNWIDGYVPNEKDKVAIIDDVFTTGGSLRKIIKILQPTGAEILGCYVVIKRGEGKLPVALSYLMRSEDLLE